MSPRVIDHDERLDTLWEEYVARHPEATLFHTLMWRDAVREVYDHPCRYLTAWQDERLAGVLPLMLIESRLAGRILVSVPYGVYGGSLADNEAGHEALLNHAAALADRLRCRWMDIRSMEARSPALPIVDRYVTFRRALPGRADQVLATLPRKARAAARQARERHELEAVFDDGQLETVWSLYTQSMRRVASVNYPLRFFRQLVDRTAPVSSREDDPPRSHRPGHLVQIVRFRGKAIAGLLSFIYRDTLMPYFAGCDERFEKLHPNNFLYLTAMERGVELGCRLFDFGRSRESNAGAYNFKRFQGFEPTPLRYQYYVPPGGRAPDLHPDNRKLEMAQRLWSRLPLAVTRPLGAWLSKSIPG